MVNLEIAPILKHYANEQQLLQYIHLLYGEKWGHWNFQLLL